MLRRCKVCGRIFTANHTGEKYCSAKCHGEKRSCSPDISRNFFEDEEKRRKKHKSTLAQESMEARKHGMTYGQWKAKKYMNRSKLLRGISEMRKTLNDRECLICHTTANLERHHVLFGNDRPLAEKYGYCVWLCHNHHNEPPYGVHFNRKMDLVVKQWAKDLWVREYGEADWNEKFGGVKHG